MEETVRSKSDLIQLGKVYDLGTSEWSAQHLMEAHSVARQYNLIPPTMKQPQYNMFHRQRFEVEYRRLYETIGLGTTIWSPLASGILTGKYNAGVPDDARINLPGYEWFREMFESDEGQKCAVTVRELSTVADKLGMNMARLTIACCLKNPNISTVITGPSRVEPVVDNMKALEVVPQLTYDVMQALGEILDNKPNSLEFQ